MKRGGHAIVSSSPIEKAGVFSRVSYRIVCLVSLVIWLILAWFVMPTALRGAGDITNTTVSAVRMVVFWQSDVGVYKHANGFTLLNSVKITVPTMLRYVLSRMTGFALRPGN